MKKALQANGNSWQLYINKPLAEMIGITEKNFVVSLIVRNKAISVQINDSTNNIPGMLVKKLIKRGSGYGLNISKPLLGILEINPETDILDIDIFENQIIIKKSQN